MKTWQKLAIGGSLAFVLLIVATYNSFVALEADLAAQQQQIDNVLIRRAELMQQLVPVVKNYGDINLELADKFVDSVEALASARDFEDRVAANQEATSQLGVILAAGLPQGIAREVDATLWSNLMTQVEGSQNRITVETMRYIRLRRSYEAKTRTFPSNLVAGFAGADLSQFPVIEAEAEQRAVPSIGEGLTRSSSQ